METPGSAPQPARPRRQRWDAARNRERILQVAAPAFAQGGAGVDMREVARLAGVGVGTLYRHFHTKEDLLQAVVQQDVAAWTEAVTRANATEDAWTGLAALLEATLTTMARHRALLDGLAAQPEADSAAAFDACRDHLERAVADLVARAHAQGTLRADVTPADLVLQVMALGRVIQLTAPGNGRSPADADATWRRHLTVVLDGLRARGGA
ncbi:TetR/AcrR family transcriptional regulator [Allostreptomyces psammosilenae]|uniref:AcrR family transcriptional regulator n=1 Tax=Allostreptomyces psammosilenae TaxID=1892865 RepID=A0A853A7V9_9ACTN|nr:TetR/AcrR family transcriptional regulator [Allostreptomyces psammosilenae]NYI06741.1 AcrR family transcriptional regulator [Allostreptomyces psammosilenae]